VRRCSKWETFFVSHEKVNVRTLLFIPPPHGGAEAGQMILRPRFPGHLPRNGAGIFSGRRVSGRTRLDCFLNGLAEGLFGEPQFIRFLQDHPILSRGAEVARQAQRGIRRDSPSLGRREGGTELFFLPRPSRPASLDTLADNPLHFIREARVTGQLPSLRSLSEQFPLARYRFAESSSSPLPAMA
jgi:hypothetical protein